MEKKTEKTMPSVECLYCGKDIEFPKRIVDTQKYNGQFRCDKCRALLHIKKVGTEIQGYRFIKKGVIHITRVETVKDYGRGEDN